MMDEMKILNCSRTSGEALRELGQGKEKRHVLRQKPES